MRVFMIDGQAIRQRWEAVNSLLVLHRPCGRPALDETFWRRGSDSVGDAVSKEVGLFLVWTSPFSSWTRGASITPTEAKQQQCSWSAFFRVPFDEVPTLAATEGERNGSHA